MSGPTRAARRLLLAALLPLLAAACSRRAAAPHPVPLRLISLAPSITETLFALRLGGRVVGVTRTCDYPPAAVGIPTVGAFLDPSYEAVVALRPDLVILPSSGVEAQRELEKLHLRTLMAPQQDLAGIHQSIRLVGGACGARAAADALLSQLTRRATAVRRAVAGRPRPRVLICVGRDIASGQLAGMSMAGAHTYYDELIRAAGGTNACTDTAATYPEFSAEGVLQTNPDVIVDLVGMLPTGGKPADRIAGQWDPLRAVAAVRQGRLHVIAGSHALRPGPRYAQFLEELARLLHPDAFGMAARHG